TAAGLDADVSAGAGRLQQGNGHHLREPGRRRAAAVSPDDAVSLQGAGALSGRPRASPLSGRLQHAGRRADDSIVTVTQLVRYSAAACQTDLGNPIDRHQMRANTDRMLQMSDAAGAG